MISDKNKQLVVYCENCGEDVIAALSSDIEPIADRTVLVTITAYCSLCWRECISGEEIIKLGGCQ